MEKAPDMIAFALSLLLAAEPAAAASSPPDIGPKPTMEEFIAIAEPALAGQVRTKRRVIFVWPYQLAAGPIGYFTCARVDPGRKVNGEDVWATAVVARGQVVNTQWSTKNGTLAWSCKRGVRDGTFLAR